jgi:hypothetical protein
MLEEFAEGRHEAQRAAAQRARSTEAEREAR